MADRKLFYDDPALDRVETVVVESGERHGRPFVRLEATVFYPEGGGQPADRGTIGAVRVLDVTSEGDRIFHVVERPLPPGPVTAVIDGALRFDRRQQHSAQHLLTALLQDRHGLPTTSFHLGESYSAIEVAGGVPSPERLVALEDQLNAEILRDRAVRSRWVEPSELGAGTIRSRGLPEGHEGAVRLVEIEGIDVNTCGGTHVDRLGQLQMLRIVDAEPARGGTRIRFLAGGRVLRELRRAASVEGELRRRLGTSADRFCEVIGSWQAERRGLEKRVQDLERELARTVGEEMARQTGPRLARILTGAGVSLLRAVANTVRTMRPDATVILVGANRDGSDACFVVQTGTASGDDAAALGARLAQMLGAKSGGQGSSFQGVGGRWRGGPSRLMELSSPP